MTPREIVDTLLDENDYGLANTVAHVLAAEDDLGGDWAYWLPIAEAVALRLRVRIALALDPQATS